MLKGSSACAGHVPVHGLVGELTLYTIRLFAVCPLTLPAPDSTIGD
jgi:hypothetical protein